MRTFRTLLLTLLAMMLAACASGPDGGTLAELRAVEVEIQEVRVNDGLDLAMQGYRSYLEENPASPQTPEAMRRLADLQVEKEYGILGDGGIRELPAREQAVPAAAAAAAVDSRPAARERESLADFEQRAAGAQLAASGDASNAERFAAALPPDQDSPMPAGPREAIELYKRILADHPYYPHNDQVLYQMSRAYDEMGMSEDAMEVMQRLIDEYPDSRYIDEVYFRRAEYFFVRRQYREAEASYRSVTTMGRGSTFYQLGLYKLGWTLYKQDFYDGALHEFIALLDDMVSIGHDFEQRPLEQDDPATRRVADTFRVLSLSFSNLGGVEVVQEYFGEHGKRRYEDRIYSNLGEFYFDKLRYQDAARVYSGFIELNPFHRVAPQFGMRVIEIYDAGGFPMLVVEAKKDFATSYALESGYWSHFSAEARPEVVSFLKSNLEDLANHFHALYQDEALAEEQQENYREAQRWYRAYLSSFPQETETPAVHYQFADLLFEQGDYGLAATEYEHIAYEYPVHERSAAAAYAAVFAHRQHQETAEGERHEEIRRQAVESSLRFTAAFPQHEHAALVLGAAADDLYAMKDFARALSSGHMLLERYPGADVPLRRSAWIVVAHANFDLERYEAAELAYSSVLGLLAQEAESRPDFIDNLAASIYKQGELANLAEDYRGAADHFLRIREMAPTSTIRAAAEYDAGAALMRLEDWNAAAGVLEAFREAHPEHELNREATKQIAHVYREDGQLARAAAEHERISAEAEDPELAREALLLAGELYEEADAGEQALAAHLRYVELFPEPVEIAVETRYKIADRYLKDTDAEAYLEQLELIVEIDAAAGSARTDRMRFLAAQSGLVLAAGVYEHFDAVQLVQPFERSLQEKQRRMDEALAAFNKLVDYEVGEVTAAATFYIGEVYYGFSQALLDSERPADLSADELLDYDMVIEEEAFPFEDLAIEVHEKNLELMSAGVFNDWVERSLDKLADLVPGRYAKFEISPGFLGSLEVYAYHSPGTEGPLAEAEDEAEIGDPDADAGDAQSGGEPVERDISSAVERPSQQEPTQP